MELVRRAAATAGRAAGNLASAPRWKKLVVFVVAGSGAAVAYETSKPDLTLSPSEIAGRKRVVVLGTGWASTSFLKNVDTAQYDVHVVSPRNYFQFTPLLPSVTVGTVEPRSIIEPIRRIMSNKRGGIKFWEAECFKIDPVNKKIHCRSAVGTNLEGNGEFVVDYDLLVVGIGATNNTFGTPGVVENCHFLKEVEDAQKIRRSVLDCFEKASLPNVSEEERKKLLHFVVVGGGPTGVEFAAELHDFVKDDLSRLYPNAKDYVRISLIETQSKILAMFDKRITEFAEEKFKRDGIDVKLNYKVVKVSDKEITMTDKTGVPQSVPYGMAVWSTGVTTRPVIKDFMKEVGQGNERVLTTDEWLRVLNCSNIYALGDCATITQRKVMDDITSIFRVADKNNSGSLTLNQFGEVLGNICDRYPQVKLYLDSKSMKGYMDLLREGDVKSTAEEEKEIIDIERFTKALKDVDRQVKRLPPTAQVAAQEGEYLAKCFNRMKKCEEHPEGPPRIRGEGRHRFQPFRYKHFGQFAPLGGEQTAAQMSLPFDFVSTGYSAQWLWYSIYASKQVSWRTRTLVVGDWLRRFVYGRDSSGL